MAENPLLPHARLRELYALLQRAHALAPRSRFRAEAVLAATIIHLEAGDALVPLPGDAVAAQLRVELDPPKKKIATKPTLPEPGALHLTLAAGAALALQQTSAADEPGRLALAFVSIDTPSDWAEPLAYAQQQQLPLLVACMETSASKSRGGSRTPSLTWPAMQRLSRKLHLPVFSVDAADAVAVYRVMQEATLRARQRGGPAVMWCATPERAADANPIKRMEKYLSVRGLLPRSKSKK